MKKTKKAILILSGALAFCLFLLVILSFVPIPKATFENCEKITGQVTEIFEGGGESDIVIFLKGDKNYYYINRGLERDLNLETLQSQIFNNEITLHFVKHWSPLDPKNHTRHIARLNFDGKLIYNEIEE